jgi:hypothetical protein
MMSEFDNDPMVDIFGSFRGEIDHEILPFGVVAARTEVRRRHRRRGVVMAAVAVLAVGVPVAAYAVTAHGPAPIVTPPLSSPSAVASPSPAVSSPAPSPSVSTSAPSTAPATQPAFGPVPGTLTYMSRLGGGSLHAHVVIVKGTKTTNRPLQSNGQVDSSSVGLSPDGTKMAWPDDKDGQLTIANIDGSGLVVRSGTDVDTTCGSPLWSPDGSHIVYGEFATTDHIIVTDATGAHPRTIGTGCRPIWSADGTHVAYIGKGGKLVVVKMDGGGAVTVPMKAGTRVTTVMSLSPGGKAIVDVSSTSACGCTDDQRYWQLDNPYVLDVATGRLTKLPTKYGTVHEAFYGADGSLLLRTGAIGTAPGKITILTAAGTVRATFTESAPLTINYVDLVGYASH